MIKTITSYLLIFSLFATSTNCTHYSVVPTVATVNENPLYEYNRQQDPEISRLLNMVESAFFNNSEHKSAQKVIHKRGADADHCENPDQEYLEGLLSEYQIHYRKFEETILKSKLDPTQQQTLSSIYTQQNTNDPSRDLSNFVDQTQCNLDDRNMTNLNQQSICPWRYIISVRLDRYPAYRTEVKCTCDSCTVKDKKALSRNIYGCVPVLRTVPVLIRSDCGTDGFFEWKPSLDEINVACVCAFNHKYLPHT